MDLSASRVTDIKFTRGFIFSGCFLFLVHSFFPQSKRLQLELEVQQMSDGVCLLERDCTGSEDLLRKEETAFARIKRADWVLQLLSCLGCLFIPFPALSGL